MRKELDGGSASSSPNTPGSKREGLREVEGGCRGRSDWKGEEDLGRKLYTGFEGGFWKERRESAGIERVLKIRNERVKELGAHVLGSRVQGPRQIIGGPSVCLVSLGLPQREGRLAR